MKNCYYCNQSTSGWCASHSPYRNWVIGNSFSKRNPCSDETDEDILQAINRANYGKMLEPITLASQKPI